MCIIAAIYPCMTPQSFSYPRVPQVRQPPTHCLAALPEKTMPRAIADWCACRVIGSGLRAAKKIFFKPAPVLNSSVDPSPTTFCVSFTEPTGQCGCLLLAALSPPRHRKRRTAVDFVVKEQHLSTVLTREREGLAGGRRGDGEGLNELNTESAAGPGGRKLWVSVTLSAAARLVDD